MITYKQRDLAGRLMLYLHEGHIIYIHGPRRSGKSSLLGYLQQTAEEKSLLLDMSIPGYRELFKDDMEGLANEMNLLGYMENEPFLLLLDNLQEAEEVLELLPTLRSNIQIIAAGDRRSLVFDDENIILDQFMIFTLMPLNFREYLRFSGYDELTTLLPDEAFALREPLPKEALKELRRQFSEFLIYGGYPETLGSDRGETCPAFFNDVMLPYLEKELPYKYLIKKKADFFRFILYLAALQGAPFNESGAARDLGHRFETMEHWKRILEDHSIIHRIPPWYQDNPNEIRRADKIFLRDTGLRNALVGNFMSTERRIDNEQLLRQYFAHIMNEYPQWQCSYWQTKQGQRVDFLLLNDFDKIPVDILYRTQKPTYLKKFIMKNELDRGICITMDTFRAEDPLRFLPAYLL